MSKNRLASGGCIQRGRELRFRFNGCELRGYEGDTLNAALLANGVHFVARSFKYHRPRGIFAAGEEDPNALFAIGQAGYLDTNTRGSLVELHDGLEARSINAWPSLEFDIAAGIGLVSRFLPAGFYYKTFKWPRWENFEGVIRRAAGLGESPRVKDAERYEHQHIHVDVLVVGGGAAGLMAARAAAEAGARVMLAEQDHLFGGALLWNGVHINGQSGADWALETVAALAVMPEVTLLSRTTVSGYFDHNYLTALERVTDHLPPGRRDRNRPRQRLWHIRAAEVVLATGAHERPAVFPDNDRPGIMLASSMREFLNRYAVTPGARVVIATNNSSAYATALDLQAAGVEIAAVVDSRPNPSGALPSAARATGMRIIPGAAIVATEGYRRLRTVTVVRFESGARQRISCDALGMSGGWTPAVHLFSQAGGKLRYDEDLAAFVPAAAVQRVHVAGAVAGRMTIAEGLEDGAAIGAEAARRSGHKASMGRTLPTVQPSLMDDADGLEAFWRLPEKYAPHARQWIDFHNDVTTADVALAARENFDSVEHCKRYTTLGMATDQGKTATVNGIAVLGEATGRSLQEVGTTTFRPPYVPLAFGAIAGRMVGDFFLPRRCLPTHFRQLTMAAMMDDYGSWRRPACYPRGGEDMAATLQREIGAVRQHVGILDYSPLGKIELRGPDALEFLNRMVLTNLATLKIGRCRYNLMLNEVGVIMDDGILTRLGEDHFLVGTTSGAADRIAAWLEYWRQCHWPHLRVYISNVTTAWGVVMISGPNARALLTAVGIDCDLAPDAFPHMSFRAVQRGDISLRLQRVSFTGELTYEVSLPTGYVTAFWDLLLQAGGYFGVTPFGIESLMVMRTEKGFLHVGGDTDGTTLPDDAGYGDVARRKASDFVGKRGLAFAEARRADRLQFVGLEALNGSSLLPVGGHCLSASVRHVPARTEGHVTTSCWSPTLRRPIALGMLAGGRNRLGEQISIYDQGRWFEARVVDPRFYDANGSRMNG